MIKLLHFSGPCSFATFLAAAGEGTLPALRFVRVFENAGVVCFLDTDSLDERTRLAMRDAIREAHAVEPVRLDHDMAMAPAVLAVVVDRLAEAD